MARNVLDPSKILPVHHWKKKGPSPYNLPEPLSLLGISDTGGLGLDVKKYVLVMVLMWISIMLYHDLWLSSLTGSNGVCQQ